MLDKQKWAANRKVYVPLKKYLSTGKCRHASTVFFQHFVDKVRVWYGYGSYWGRIFTKFGDIRVQYVLAGLKKKYAFGD